MTKEVVTNSCIKISLIRHFPTIRWQDRKILSIFGLCLIIDMTNMNNFNWKKELFSFAVFFIVYTIISLIWKTDSHSSVLTLFTRSFIAGGISVLLIYFITRKLNFK